MSQATGRNTAIDSLRGLAALVVLVMHARGYLWVGLSALFKSEGVNWFNLDNILALLSLPFRWGSWGVPLFFVISGYCIHRPEARKLKANPDYRLVLGYYASRRFWRIYPVLVVALLLTTVLDHVTRTLVPGDDNLGDNSLYCFIVNLCSLQNIVAPRYGSNLPLWTLSVEMHFYVVYPLFFWASRKFGMIAPMATIFFISAGSWVLLELTGNSTILFTSYWFTWVVGAYIAEAEAGFVRFPRTLLAWLSVPCMIIALSLERWRGLFVDLTPVDFTVLALPFALLVWHAVTSPTSWAWTNRFSRAAAVVGLFSYSLYATHQPVLIAYRAVIQGGDRSPAFLSVVSGSVVSLAIGIATYLLVEQWTLKPRGHSKERQPHNQLELGPARV